MDIPFQIVDEFAEQLKARLILKSAELQKDSFTIDEIIELVKKTGHWMSLHDAPDRQGVFGDPRDWANGLPKGMGDYPLL